VNGQSLACATVHLESLNNEGTRKEQLRIAEHVLRPFDNAILVGDFNFDSSINFYQLLLARSSMIDSQILDPAVPYPPDTVPLENNNLGEIFKTEEWIDVWPELHPNEKGYSFDSAVNGMLLDIEQMRYDRVIFRSKNKTWIPKNISLLGTKRIENESAEIHSDIPLFPSDHFGLVAMIEIQNS